MQMDINLDTNIDGWWARNAWCSCVKRADIHDLAKKEYDKDLFKQEMQNKMNSMTKYEKNLYLMIVKI